MRIRRTALPFVAAVAAAVALAACGSNGPDVAAATAPSAGPQYNPQPYDNIKDGGTITSGLREIPAQLNILQGDTTGWSGNLWPWTNPVLVTYKLDGTPEFNPDYLTDVKQDEVGGNTRVTYTINPKAFFNDGTPLDWKAFEGTWKAVKGDDPNYFVGAASGGYRRIATLQRGIDDRQVVVTFTGGYVGWQGLFNNVLHPKATESPEAWNKAYIDNPHPEWGAGPYTVLKFDRKGGIARYERNPKWWGQPGKLDNVTFLQLEQTASINAFRNNQIDYTSASTKERLEQVRGMAGIELRRGAIAQTGVYTLNAKSPVLSDKRVRKAVLMGIDRDQLSKITSQGLGFSEPLSGSLALIPSQTGYRDNLSRVLSFDPEKAKADLDAVGWVPGADGIRVKDGAPLRFTYVRSGDSELSRATGSALIAMMKTIGVQLDVRQVASAEFSDVINGRKFDMFSWSYNQPDPFGMAYLCDLYCTDGSSNLSGTGTPELDAKLKAISAFPNADQQNAAGNDLEVEAFSDYGQLTTSPLPTVYAVKSGLVNVGALPFTVPLPQYVGWQK